MLYKETVMAHVKYVINLKVDHVEFCTRFPIIKCYVLPFFLFRIHFFVGYNLTMKVQIPVTFIAKLNSHM